MALYHYRILKEVGPDKYEDYQAEDFTVEADDEQEAGAAAQTYIENLAATDPGTYAAERAFPDAPDAA